MVIPYDPFYQPFVVRSLNFASELASRGHHVQYFYDTMRPSKRGNRIRGELPAGFEAHPCSWHKPQEFARLRAAVAQCDVVHFQKAKPPHSWAAIALARAYDKPLHQDWDDDEGAFWLQTARDRARALSLTEPESVVLTAKAALIAALSGATERIIPRVADTMGAATIALRRKSEQWGARKGAIFPARVGVDCALFSPSRRDPELRRALGLSGPTVLYSGSLDIRPDLDFFVEAVRTMVQYAPEARCLVLGDGFGRRHLRDAIARAGVAGHVMFSNGLVPFAEMPRYVASCDVAALPFRDNAVNRGKSSLTLLECMASGVPAVTHDVGDIGWMLGDGGALARLDDPADFGRKLAELLADPARCQKLAAAGRARAERHFGWAGTVTYLERAYHHAIAEHSHAAAPALSA